MHDAVKKRPVNLFIPNHHSLMGPFLLKKNIKSELTAKKAIDAQADKSCSIQNLQKKND